MASANKLEGLDLGSHGPIPGVPAEIEIQIQAILQQKTPDTNGLKQEMGSDADMGEKPLQPNTVINIPA